MNPYGAQEDKFQEASNVTIGAAKGGKGARYPWEDAAVETFETNDAEPFCQTVEGTKTQEIERLRGTLDNMSDDDSDNHSCVSDEK